MKYISLKNTIQKKNVGKNISIKGVIGGKDLVPYIVPKEYVFNCELNNFFEYIPPFKKCKNCPAWNKLGLEIAPSLQQITLEEHKIHLDLDNNDDKKMIMKFINKADSHILIALSKKKLAPNCPNLTIKTLSNYIIEDITLVPEIDFNNLDDEYTVRQAYCIGEDIKTNLTYEMNGVVLPNPYTQKGTLFIDNAKLTVDSVDNFKMTEEIDEKLKIFQSADNTKEEIYKKLLEIQDDLENNVTFIYNRKDIIFAVDLVFHSVLQFNFLGKTVEKGWIEGLVIGDTRTGKSKTITQLMKHYKAGDKINGENTSLAGLLAGLEEISGRWSLMWGKIPLNDKGLLFVDELSGMQKEELSKLSDVRSSGIAEITKIEKYKTYARTRLLWGSNPRTKKVSQYNYGIMAIKELFGNPEDIARLDFALMVAFEEVNEHIYNSRHNEAVEPKYNSEVSNLLIRFAWSRKQEDVIIPKEVEDLILEKATYFSKTYSPVIPLINSAEISIKIAKIGVALATRLYSVEDNKIVVHKGHIEVVTNWLNSIYSKSSMGYKLFSKQRLRENSIKKEDKSFLIGMIGTDKDIIEILLDMNRFSVSDLSDIFALDRNEMKKQVSKLVKMRVLKKVMAYYFKSPAFIEFLKNYDKEVEKQNKDIPADDTIPF